MNPQDLAQKEAESVPEYLEIPITRSARCVDGRPDFDVVEKGPQMLGGSIHPILLKAIQQNRVFNKSLVTDGISELRTLGFKVGVHRGEHATHTVKTHEHHTEEVLEHPKDKTNEKPKSDCGAADRTDEIIAKAIKQKTEIKDRLKEVYEANKEKFGELNKPFEQMLDEAYEKIEKFGPEKIQVTGEETIKTAEEARAQIENLKGDHSEGVAYVNLKKGVTFDTNESNRKGKQAFNLDLLEVVKQARALRVDKDFAITASLILYQATEMVLVESKGKKALRILIHS